jgi:molybdopterin/thiamine biosynthesis adenylyltransferase/rhodanese-related sulfurtransferase
MIGYHDLVARLRPDVTEVMADDLAGRLDAVRVLIDIREPNELASGFIPGAVHVPRGVLESAVERLPRDTEVVLYCSGGNRSVLAAASLAAMGFTNVSSLAGGSTAWRMRGHPVSMPAVASPVSEATPAPAASGDRHARQIALPEIGPDGQRALSEASVLVVGAGGLGSPVATYLAGAGVGRIAVADPDVVDVTNLHRQTLHDTGSVGRRKVESAAERLRRIDPGLAIETHPTAITASSADDLLQGHDLVIDCTDNFPTRYLLNDAALRARIPLVHGSVFRFEGQVSVFQPYEGPCYRCLFPTPPPPELAPNCATAGVLGPTTGAIGSLMAIEAIKLLAGVDPTLVGSLLMVDTLTQNSTRLGFERDPGCVACGDPGAPPELVDYDDGCLPPTTR